MQHDKGGVAGKARRLLAMPPRLVPCPGRRHPEGGLIEEMEVVVVRFRAELRAPGCMHIVLECVSPQTPYLLENRADQALRYRQVGIPDLPYVPLPSYSAAGFAWQKDPLSGGIASVRHTPWHAPESLHERPWTDAGSAVESLKWIACQLGGT